MMFIMRHQDLFKFIQLCAMSECFKIFKMCPRFVLIKIVSVGHSGHDCDIFFDATLIP